MKDVPTDAELEAAEQYALSKMCTEIPNSIGSGLTMWDSSKKKCVITQKGCTPGYGNPLSQPKYNSAGNEIKINKLDRRYGKFWQNWKPDFYVYKTTKLSPTKKVCSRGNFLLYQWCEFPNTRAGGGYQKGVTNVPRFTYMIKNGKEQCGIPKKYCEAKGVSYSSSKQDCYVSKGQQAGEFFASGSMVRSLKVSDKRLKTNIKLFKKDFAGKGINLYQYDWTPTASKLYGNNIKGDLGFIADELPSNYTYTDVNGYKNIDTDLNTYEMNNINNFLYLKKLMFKLVGDNV